ncbi:hypothetical protein WICPIJ_006218 [Wickerhamomyces pijperi]|uniref:C2H2-type domain-containing protein n=1 Tax=Wickerhamomyces pijperi TaxID=599730 RepID=A0A9P8Q474_WICPI|nr:hypothetical protein WICPIJ_006218 [Wickerhamomyces pijperi]
MAKAEFGTPKHLANQMKARGLQKLKWHCQVCSKQCRDANGFQSHIRSETHLRKISNVTGEDIENYSKDFQTQFLKDLKDYHGEKFINANKFYNSVIQDKDHVHLNSTKWSSLSQFIQHLSKTGLIRIKADQSGNPDEDQGLSSLDISYINNSSDNILRQEMLKKSEDDQKKEESLEMRLLKQQIERGNQGVTSQEENKIVKPTDREESEKPVKISLGFKKKDNEIEKKSIGMGGFKIGKPSVNAPSKKNIFK